MTPKGNFDHILNTVNQVERFIKYRLNVLSHWKYPVVERL